MKRILFILLMLILLVTGCETTPIKERLFVSTIGFDYLDNQYVIYLYLPSSTGIGKSETSELQDAHIAKEKGQSISAILTELQKSTELVIYYSQLKSIIMTERFMNPPNIKKMVSVFRNDPAYPLDFYVFGCGNDDLEKLFEVKNPDDSTTLNTIFSNPRGQIANILYKDPVSYSNFVTKFLDGYDVPVVSYLKSTKTVWKEKEELTTVETYGLCYITNKATCYNKKDDKGLGYLRNRMEFVITLDNLELLVKNHHFNLRYNEEFVLEIQAVLEVIVNEEEVLDSDIIIRVNEYFRREIKESLDKCFNDSIDVLGFKDYYYRHGNLDKYVNFYIEKYSFDIKIEVV